MTVEVFGVNVMVFEIFATPQNQAILLGSAGRKDVEQESEAEERGEKSAVSHAQKVAGSGKARQQRKSGF